MMLSSVQLLYERNSNISNKKSLLLLLVFFLSFSIVAQDFRYPKEEEISSVESVLPDINDWKLQIPGLPNGITITELTNYKSRYFSKNSNGEIHFALDASETGHTGQTLYVRSELQHKAHWDLKKPHELFYTIKSDTNDRTKGYTIGQIHIVKDTIAHPEEHSPLLRIEVKDGALRAVIKNFDTKKYCKIKLCDYTYGEYVRIGMVVKKNQLAIYINGNLIVDAYDISSCKYPCYFKLGLYPQDVQGFFVADAKDIVYSSDF